MRWGQRSLHPDTQRHSYSGPTAPSWPRKWSVASLNCLVIQRVDRLSITHASLQYHRLRGSASPVLTATGLVIGRWQFSPPPPTESTPLNRSPKNSHWWLRRRPVQLCQIWCTSDHGGFWANGWINITEIFMVALCNRADHYMFALYSFFLLPSIFFSSPNLSGRRLDVYHTSTHGVALVRI